MSLSAVFPSIEEGLALHLRLCAEDPMAPAEVCAAYLEPLLSWLESVFPCAEEPMRQSAVHDALLGYVQQPQVYDPRRGELGAYLRRAARGDWCNLWRREDRHRRRQIPWNLVELGEEAGNLSGRESEPWLLLEREEEAASWQQLLERFRGECDPVEQCVLDLMLAGERNTRVFALAIGLADVPRAEQEIAVKRVKDCIKKRLERARRPKP
jgi:RNA polymerase sigma-70 factor (ECF subfamily)